MSSITVKPTANPDVIVVVPRRSGDERGFFAETYNVRDYKSAGIMASFVQDNLAFSAQRGTLRGLHFQRPPAAQAKLVRVVRGRVFDVAVDLRVGSPNYGSWVGTTLTAGGGEQVFIPSGFAHGYCTLEPDTEVAYKVDGLYAPDYEDGIAWNDPEIGIMWPVAGEEVMLSEKDRQLGPLSALSSPFHFNRRSDV